MKNRLVTLAIVLALQAGLAAPARALEAGDEYRLGFGDAVSIKVLGQQPLSVEDQAIRPDGRISLPLVKEVLARGKTVGELTEVLSEAYHPYLTDASVVVTVSRFRPLKITLLGQVSRPGTFSFEAPPTLLDALAASGGLTERGDRTRIKLIEASGRSATYTLDGLLSGRESAPRVAEGSVIEVAEVWGPDMYRALPVIASIITAAALMMRVQW